MFRLRGRFSYDARAGNMEPSVLNERSAKREREFSSVTATSLAQACPRRIIRSRPPEHKTGGLNESFNLRKSV